MDYKLGKTDGIEAVCKYLLTKADTQEAMGFKREATATRFEVADIREHFKDEADHDR